MLPACPASEAAKPAAASGGWDLSFLQKNQAAGASHSSPNDAAQPIAQPHLALDFVCQGMCAVPCTADARLPTAAHAARPLDSWAGHATCWCNPLTAHMLTPLCSSASPRGCRQGGGGRQALGGCRRRTQVQLWCPDRERRLGASSRLFPGCWSSPLLRTSFRDSRRGSFCTRFLCRRGAHFCRASGHGRSSVWCHWQHPCRCSSPCTGACTCQHRRFRLGGGLLEGMWACPSVCRVERGLLTPSFFLLSWRTLPVAHCELSPVVAFCCSPTKLPPQRQLRPQPRR